VSTPGTLVSLHGASVVVDDVVVDDVVVVVELVGFLVGFNDGDTVGKLVGECVGAGDGAVVGNGVGAVVVDVSKHTTHCRPVALSLKSATALPQVQTLLRDRRKSKPCVARNEGRNSGS